MNSLPFIIRPHDLAQHPQLDDFLIIDVGKAGIYEQAHLPHAIHLDYAKLLLNQAPVANLPPTKAQIEALLSEIGLTPDTHVIAYDDEGGGRASRFLWTLALAGHQRFSLLNGGIHAWLEQNLPYSTEPHTAQASHYRIESLDPAVIVDVDYLKNNYQNPDLVIWDTRSPNEYSGCTATAKRCGHIPGAVNYPWDNTFDRGNHNLLHEEESIKQDLAEQGITPEKEVIVHCQTHHRSSFAWVLAKHLGYDNVRAYAGSWAEWGNREDTPVVQ